MKCVDQVETGVREVIQTTAADQTAEDLAGVVLVADDHGPAAPQQEAEAPHTGRNLTRLREFHHTLQ